MDRSTGQHRGPFRRTDVTRPSGRGTPPGRPAVESQTSRERAPRESPTRPTPSPSDAETQVETDSSTPGGDPVTAERRSLSVSLFARGTTDAKAREASVFERLRTLRRTGRIEKFSVRTWPGEVSFEGVGHSEVVDTYRTFEAWAQSHEASVSPPFSIRERRSAFTDQSDTLLVTPLVSVAVYDEDEVVGVYPCIHDDAVTTIDECLDWLADESESTVCEPIGKAAGGEASGSPRDRLATTDHGHE